MLLKNEWATNCLQQMVYWDLLKILLNYLAVDEIQRVDQDWGGYNKEQMHGKCTYV